MIVTLSFKTENSKLISMETLTDHTAELSVLYYTFGTGCCWRGAGAVLCCPGAVGMPTDQDAPDEFTQDWHKETLTEGAGLWPGHFYRTASNAVATAELTHAPTCEGAWKRPKVSLQHVCKAAASLEGGIRAGEWNLIWKMNIQYLHHFMFLIKITNSLSFISN